MKHIVITTIGFIALSCGREDKKEASLQASTPVNEVRLSADTANVIDSEPPTDAGGDYQTMYIIVADTSNNYYELHKQMFALHTSLKQEIDTMGRYYDKKLGKIILPEDDEDDIYAGEYYPRRYASSSLSLEYLEMYSDKASVKTIALVAGIYESEKRADSAFALLKEKAPKAFRLKSEVYMGCMH
ncbi:hypothetical protein ACLI09_02450 [Flavobacterium sp. RHBU_24]|uniref:hypothetical protein n=1 Tax=Flavobacterium sp. RHBU_24 TaxID=3391185 RepID=UPI003984ACE5